ncbi:MAG: (deoxy)nucleoside triphosphate pyrophosphohydrolase [Erysipelotrichaceae bacterium]|nr:(deoxy)nucleoside triphosphate pyrophosphohydrolase [Erysipelotrichaceae bacterium]MDD3809770.1 (deoxy)nucleoside triphosphate pyrophosphohydrolase [Erysipelotrichaceae bacterium]
MKTIRVVAAIIKHQGKILIARRSYGEFQGLWEFPGGKIEDGEDGIAALKREISEELNVEITVLDFFMKATYSYPRFYLDMDCYWCSLATDDFQLEAHSQIRWIEPDQKDIDWVPADVQIIERIKEYGCKY